MKPPSPDQVSALNALFQEHTGLSSCVLYLVRATSNHSSSTMWWKIRHDEYEYDCSLPVNIQNIAKKCISISPPEVKSIPFEDELSISIPRDPLYDLFEPDEYDTDGHTQINEAHRNLQAEAQQLISRFPLISAMYLVSKNDQIPVAIVALAPISTYFMPLVWSFDEESWVSGLPESNILIGTTPLYVRSGKFCLSAEKDAPSLILTEQTTEPKAGCCIGLMKEKIEKHPKLYLPSVCTLGYVQDRRTAYTVNHIFPVVERNDGGRGIQFCHVSNRVEDDEANLKPFVIGTCVKGRFDEYMDATKIESSSDMFEPKKLHYEKVLRFQRNQVVLNTQQVKLLPPADNVREWEDSRHAVFKVGTATGLTKGHIHSGESYLHDNGDLQTGRGYIEFAVKGIIPESYKMYNQLIIYPDSKLSNCFAQPGDSGALVFGVTEEELEKENEIKGIPLALLIGTIETHNSKMAGVATPLQVILDAL